MSQDKSEPSGREDLAGLLERLLKRKLRWSGGYSKVDDGTVNPDGPEAHAAIIALEQENAKLREALKPFASNYVGRVGLDDCWTIGGTNNPPLNNGHLRHAAEALRADVEG